ncbi:3-oxoacyl-[acyl-carrier-protein] synthase II [Actinopolyspora alba]|uniref:3-oxoacyl-[acyl-carrier-protein] synthase II n=1 Tax=Actinopolyspora alba TaxID=673379 RepID=A0A1I1TPH3_9ACTN|nr:3-oxoacyl-[acyl-carrier-protein] synthase II [Actinopolyspora alba]
MIISGFSVISSYGIGFSAFESGIGDERCALSTIDSDDGRPVPGVARVPNFDVRSVLGDDSVNIDRLGRPAALAMGTVGLLLDEYDTESTVAERRGIVLGGAMMTADRSMSIMRESLTGTAPYHVDPKLLPGSAMNYPSSQCAIRYGLKGLNSTVTTGRLTGLSALNYTRRMHERGRADVVLAGAIEDLNQQRCRLVEQAHGQRRSPLGEGACVFLTESEESARRHGRSNLIGILALEFGTATSVESAGEVLAHRITRALRRSGLVAEDVWAVAVSAPEGATRIEELHAVSSTIRDQPRTFAVDHLIGDTDGASGCFQLLGGFVRARRDPVPGGNILLVTSVDPDGQVGCGLFRIH